MKDTIIVRYGELSLKSKQTRRVFELVLVENIKQALNNDSIKFNSVKREYGRIYIDSTDVHAIDSLKNVFGVVSFSHAVSCDANLDTILKTAETVALKHISKKDTFAVRATRTGTHDFSSNDIHIKLGDLIRKTCKATVNLKNPDKVISVEVRNKGAYVFTDIVYGPGGLPLSVEGSVLGIFENKKYFDVAAYMMAKRGCSIELICKENDRKKAEKFMKSNSKWLGKVSLHVALDGEDLYEKAVSVSKSSLLKALFTADVLGKDQVLVERLSQKKKDLNFPLLFPVIAYNEDFLKNVQKKLT